ncbi:hypothetical protein ACRE_028860 [Hapsidospora chrysogenum ATCC 11550]|uniref:Transcription factor tau subunit sfc3/Tfc3 C-terminal domain-containing protein n=1 Tax=Hapsidospora chrysogenum (strain ATCC 11550 / CBS 779.69 / DSM 880 / IAM 14645 / JCM 23072 / IMI 49137) TaxID=857340 RepID=A0A086TAD1_HAPC1|nr:hypothetical protein ACRE_028860 [Hapsidospora chrysogenum ATCC 11550]
MAWDRHYPSETSPTTRGFHSSLKWLTGMNKLADHWHAFRGRNGVFSKCQIVTWPHIDAFSPEALDVMDKIKEAHPKLYIPENVESADGLNLRVDGEFVNSRRPLPEIVSVLDAPVYAAQRAAKRELEEAEDEGRERKRRQKTTRSTRGTKGQVRWISDIRGETLDPRSTASLVGADKDPSIQFLEPNTHLDEEEPSGFSLNELSQGRRPSAANKAARTTPRNSREPDVGSSPSSGIIAPSYIWDIGVGAWPNHDIRFFDEVNSSVTLQGWFPSSKWHAWAAIVEEIDKRAGAKASRGWFRTHEDSPYQRFLNRLRACIEVEMSWVEAFVHASRGVAGPHNTFIQFFCRPTEDLREMGDISWPSDGQLTPDNMSRGTDVFDIAESSGDDDENGILGPLLSKNERGRGTGRRGRRPRRIYDIRKRVPLVRRRLTALPKRDGRRTEESSEAAAAQQAESVRDPGEVLSAIIVVRTLLGGIERAIDWGLLAHVFPDMTLGSLRKVWFEAQKSQGAHIAKFTRDFSERFIAACKNDEVPMIDFDHPLDYDWDSLIKWAMEIPGQEDVEIPSTLEGLGERYTLHDAKSVDEDWRERYFHAQASTYSRLDLVTAIPGATAADGLENPALPSNADVARSWMRSLCCTGETAHTPKDVKEGLLRLVVDDEQKVASLLKTAIEQLTRHKIIHKSLRPGLGGRPYRLTEWYLSTVAKLSQWAKYQEAAAVKAQLDTLYRNGESFKVPYTINDGAMMALMNMSAYGRIRLLSQDVPYIPFGFEPGNYESRKYPKSYYHFNLAAVPTETYQFNEDIPCLQAVAGEPPPSRGPRHAIPQWIDFFGHCDMNMWCKVLGAVCFAYSTRGQMGIDVLCSALRPTLEPFEAQMILDWGRKTGVLEASPLGKGVTVGEWWWLAVPWQQQQQAT